MTSPLASAFISGFISLVAVGLSYFYNKRIVAQKNTEDEKKEIYKKLNDFFGPFQAILKKNKMPYDLLVVNHKLIEPNFKAFIYLLNGMDFQGNDKFLFDEIIKNNDMLEKIIIEKAGLVDSTELRNIFFPKFITHCNLIKLAYSKQLSGEPERFEEYIFPKGIDVSIEKEFVKYNNRLNELNNFNLI